MFLTPDELKELTGLKAPHAQRRWLEKNDWVFVLNANHRPIVGREYAARRLGCGRADEVQQAARPNFDALRAS